MSGAAEDAAAPTATSNGHSGGAGGSGNDGIGHGVGRGVGNGAGDVGLSPGPYKVGNGIEPPRKIKVARPASDVKHAVKGDWKLDLVIDATGAVRDLHVAERPTVVPEWPEFESHVLAAVKASRIGPAAVEGQPWPYCLTVTVKD